MCESMCCLALSHLCSVDELIRKALADGLDVSEGCFTGPSAEQVDGLVHSTEGRHIHSLSSYCTRPPNAGGVLSRTTVSDCLYKDLQGILNRREGKADYIANLQPYLYGARAQAYKCLHCV